MQCLHIPTEFTFCTPQLVVGKGQEKSGRVCVCVCILHPCVTESRLGTGQRLAALAGTLCTIFLLLLLLPSFQGDKYWREAHFPSFEEKKTLQEGGGESEDTKDCFAFSRRGHFSHTRAHTPNQQRTFNKLLTELRRRNFVNKHRRSIKIGAQRAKKRACNVYVLQLSFCVAYHH